MQTERPRAPASYASSCVSAHLIIRVFKGPRVQFPTKLERDAPTGYKKRKGRSNKNPIDSQAYIVSFGILSSAAAISLSLARAAPRLAAFPPQRNEISSGKLQQIAKSTLNRASKLMLHRAENYKWPKRTLSLQLAMPPVLFL